MASRNYLDYYQATERLEDLERLILILMDAHHRERPTPAQLPSVLMTLVAEVVAALEEARAERWSLQMGFARGGTIDAEGFPIAMARVLVRVLEITAAWGLPTRDAVALALMDEDQPLVRKEARR